MNKNDMQNLNEAYDEIHETWDSSGRPYKMAEMRRKAEKRKKEEAAKKQEASKTPVKEDAVPTSAGVDIEGTAKYWADKCMNEVVFPSIAVMAGRGGRDTIPALLAAFDKQIALRTKQIQAHQSMHDKIRPKTM